MTEHSKCPIKNHRTTQHLYYNLAAHKTFSNGLTHLILMENAQSLGVHNVVRQMKVTFIKGRMRYK